MAGMRMNTVLLKTAVRVWLMEILVSGFNFFVLMDLVYEPRWGALAAHQIGMSSRIVYISIFAYLLLSLSFSMKLIFEKVLTLMESRRLFRT